MARATLIKSRGAKKRAVLRYPLSRCCPAVAPNRSERAQVDDVSCEERGERREERREKREGKQRIAQHDPRGLVSNEPEPKNA